MIYQAMLVDDEEIACRGLAKFIKWKEHGFEVAGIAYCVEDALALLKTIHVDVLFMDIRMPGKTGLEMLPILKEEYPDIKTVILSGYSDFSYAQEALRYQAFDYLTKPVNLGELEQLLDRLRMEFERQQRQLEVDFNRTEALLLSVAKGYAEAVPEKFALPVMNGWFGLAMAMRDRQLPEDEIVRRKNAMKEQIMAVVPGALILDETVFTLFGLIPCHSQEECGTFLSTLEQFCAEWQEWLCGVSGFQENMETLHTAWQEAGQALRYLQAGARQGVILFQNIKPLFSQDEPRLQEVVAGTFNRLADAKERGGVLMYAGQGIRAILEGEDLITRRQVTGIRFLIELNGLLNKLNLSEEDLHMKLNETLAAILLCQSANEIQENMMRYLEWLLALVERIDEQQLGKGIIREIQLYIRSHYGENISLNSLSEHFFLHSNYLSRLFKEKTGQNFIDYLIEVRMEKAKELLRTTDYKIVEICAVTGYDNPRYFSKLFKQYTGLTPREYREQAG